MKWQEHSQRIQTKILSSRKQRCIQTPKASKKTQQLSKLTQQHLIFPQKAKLRAYMTMCRKPKYIRGYPSKNHVYMRLWRQNSCTGRKIDKKEGKQTSWEKNLLLLDTTRKTCPQTRLRNREIKAIQEHWMSIKTPKGND